MFGGILVIIESKIKAKIIFRYVSYVPLPGGHKLTPLNLIIYLDNVN